MNEQWSGTTRPTDPEPQRSGGEQPERSPHSPRTWVQSDMSTKPDGQK